MHKLYLATLAVVVLTLGCLECPRDDDDSADTYEDPCAWTEVDVDLDALVCVVTWPGTVDEYTFASLYAGTHVDGLVAMWATWGPSYTEWGSVTYVDVDDCDGIAVSPVQMAPPDVAVVAGEVLVRMVPGGSPPESLLLLECE